MASHLGNGLVGFSRHRVGLRPPTQGYSPNGTVHTASIHHGGPVGGPRMSFKSARATWVEWQRFHQNDRGWSDIGYHVGVDGLGRLYMGRPATAVPAAVQNHNTGTVGIVFMQDGRHFKLNALQRRNLKVLFEKGVPRWGIRPLKTMRVRCHNEFDGHESNECPGQFIKRHVLWRRGRYT